MKNVTGAVVMVKMKMKSNEKRFAELILLNLSILIVIIAMGCTVSDRAGRRQISSEVSSLFELYQILPNHRYYHIGWDTRPYAIVGLKEPYHITSKFWFQFDAESTKLKRRVDGLEIFFERGYNRAYGYYLVDKTGNRIGVWYSSIYIFSARVNDADNAVTITMDKPWVTGDRFGL